MKKLVLIEVENHGSILRLLLQLCHPLGRLCSFVLRLGQDQ